MVGVRLLCLFIVASYIPQYLNIIRHGTSAISSRYVLFHCLFSTAVLALRLQHPMFYRAFNCVNGGSYHGWRAYSALLGFIQAAAQFVAALVLLAIYLRYRTPSTPATPVEHPSPGSIASTTLRAIVSTAVITVVPVSFAFLWYNKSPLFDDDDDPASLGRFIAVYVFGLGAWTCVLIPACIVFAVLQFAYEVRTVRELQTGGALSLVGLLMQATAFILLAVAQTLRSWAGIQWLAGPWGSKARFLENLMAFYGTINTQVAYFLTGVGFLGLFFVALFDGRGVGRISLS